MIVRALLLCAVLASAAPASAQNAPGGIQVAPVLVQMTPERAFGSLRVRNGRDRPTSFEVDVYAWTQVNGEDVLTPTDALVAAPGVFEMQPGAEQIVRLGAVAPGRERETAFRIILRELPTPQGNGARLGFTLEMSLPVFVTPRGAEASLDVETRDDLGLVVSNTGAAHARLISAESDEGALALPRYLLAGSQAAAPLPRGAESVRFRLYQGANQIERIVQVDDAGSRPSMR